MTYLKKLKLAYYACVFNAKKRDIPFRLTFEHWFKIWDDSGHLHERGCKRGQYCMARFNDKGAYRVGNVKIILHTENIREWIRTDEVREKQRKAGLGNKNGRYSKGVTRGNGRKHTDETKRKISLSGMGNTNNLGKKRTEATKRKMSHSMKLAWQRKKESTKW